MASSHALPEISSEIVNFNKGSSNTLWEAVQTQDCVRIMMCLCEIRGSYVYEAHECCIRGSADDVLSPPGAKDKHRVSMTIKGDG